MKTSLAPNHDKPNVAPMFPITAHPEEGSPPPLRRTPLTDLRPHAQELEAAFQNAKREHDAFEASRKSGRSDHDDAGANAASKSNGPGNDPGHAPAGCKLVEFYLEAPLAGQVKLAADFTDWEESPLNMIKSEGGVWSIFVPLRRGSYSYHFIVDGERRDDPLPVLQGVNAGATDAVVNVP